MIDHVGFSVSDYARAKTFYETALAPLGYVLVMEVQQDDNDAPAAGFGANGKPDFWIGGEGGLNKPVHIAITAKDRASVDAFYQAAMAAATLKGDMPPLALPAAEYMTKARAIWEELGLPRIVPQSPWHGYELGDWDAAYTVFAEAAVAGDWRKSGEQTYGRRHGGLKPETPVREAHLKP